MNVKRKKVWLFWLNFGVYDEMKGGILLFLIFIKFYWFVELFCCICGVLVIDKELFDLFEEFKEYIVNKW